MEEQLLCSSSSSSGSIGSGGTATTTSKLTFTVVFSSFVAVFATFGFGCATGYSSPSETGIMRDLGLTIAQYSLFGSFMTLGSVLGATISGRFSDYIGRKRGIWFFQAFFITGWLAIAFAKASTQPSKKEEGSDIMQLLDRQYARPLFVGIGICILLPLSGGTAIVYYASSILETAGCNISIGTTVTALIQLPFSIFGVLAMDRFGRRQLLMVDLAGFCMGGILAGVAFLLQDLGVMKDFTPTIALTSMIINFAFYALAVGLPAVIVSELFPMKIKGYAASLASLGFCFSSWIVTYTFNFLFLWISSGAFFTFALFSALAIIFVAKLMPETKGLSLEEIAALWLDKNSFEQNE